MNAKIFLLALVALPWVQGCANASSEPVVDTNALVEIDTKVSSPDPLPTNALPAEAVPIGQPVNTNWVAPANVKLSPAASEVAKLAQAGVDSSVMLAFVTNSPNTFRLEADDIVYLNDIGMSSDVVSAMIHHDQNVRGASVSGAVAASPATPAPDQSVWAAQSTTNANVWQQPVSEPAPAAQVEAPTLPPPPPEEQAPPETVNYFYDSLAPYGTWIDIDGYGRCWRPTVVATYSGWQPYRNNGRWVWTDAGWYWYSDYSWGWAPFHYGRWFSHPRWGWCWVPGSVWGPSWVSWRYSDDYCGWAPLPPAAYYSPSIGFTYYGRSCGSGFSFGLGWNSFTFVSYHNFHSRRYDRDCVPRHSAGRVYQNTTVVNNIIRGNNNTIINQGIAPTRISAVSGTRIQQATIRETRAPRTSRHEVLAQDGRTLQVVQPNIPAGTVQGHAAPTRNTRGGNTREGNTRGGAQGLINGNANTTTALSPAPNTRSSGTGRTPPVRDNAGTASSVAQPTTPTATAAPVPNSNGGTSVGGPGRRPPVRDNLATPRTSPSTAAQPTAPAPTASTAPNKNDDGNNVRGSRRQPPVRDNEAPNTASSAGQPATAPSPRNESSAAPAPTRNEGNPLIIRNPRPTRSQSDNATAAANVANPTPAPTRSAPVVNSTPQTPRQERSQGTPWLNNNPAPAPSQAVRPTAPSRTWQQENSQEVRSAPRIERSAPSTPAPSPRSAPTYQAPSNPRSFGAPAPPQPAQSYTPPVRTAPSAPSYSQPAYAPPARTAPASPAPSQPSYSPPARNDRPSYTPPPSRPESQSSSRSESKSESRGSTNSREERSSRGR